MRRRVFQGHGVVAVSYEQISSVGFNQSVEGAVGYLQSSHVVEAVNGIVPCARIDCDVLIGDIVENVIVTRAAVD